MHFKLTAIDDLCHLQNNKRIKNELFLKSSSSRLYCLCRRETKVNRKQNEIEFWKNDTRQQIANARAITRQF